MRRNRWELANRAPTPGRRSRPFRATQPCESGSGTGPPRRSGETGPTVPRALAELRTAVLTQHVLGRRAGARRLVILAGQCGEMRAGGVRTGEKSRRYLDDLGDNLSLSEIVAEGALASTRRTRFGRVDARPAVRISRGDEGGDAMAAPGQSVDGAAKERDRPVQDDQTAEQEGLTRTIGHLIRFIRSGSPKGC
jgi:hypothetical protein